MVTQRCCQQTEVKTRLKKKKKEPLNESAITHLRCFSINSWWWSLLIPGSAHSNEVAAPDCGLWENKRRLSVESLEQCWAPARKMKLCSHWVLSISMRADGDHAWGTVGMTKQRWVRHWLVCRENFPRPSEEKHTQAFSGRWHLADVVDFLRNNTIHGLERTVVARPVQLYNQLYNQLYSCFLRRDLQQRLVEVFGMRLLDKGVLSSATCDSSCASSADKGRCRWITRRQKQKDRVGKGSRRRPPSSLGVWSTLAH